MPTTMKKLNLTLGADNIALSRKLAKKYGGAASASSVCRRALHLLADVWEQMDGSPEAALAERGAMIEHLAVANRGRGRLRR